FIGLQSDPEEKLIHRRLRHKVRGINSPDGVLGEIKDIHKFAKDFDCVVAIVKEDALDEGYTYYYHESGQDYVVPSSNMLGAALREKPIYRVAAMGNLEKGGARFKSVVWDPDMTIDAPILPLYMMLFLRIVVEKC
ncbi:MAG: hypothetical protein Q8R43_03825, partial [Alphaproteobacteria bacterium]|nr:hypothetical protein [Alphaproteobacteria bacterium]